MSRDYLPAGDEALLTWANNFNSIIIVDYATLGLALSQTTAYTAVLETFQTKYTEATSLLTRTPPAIEAKAAAKATLMGLTRVLVRIIQAFPAVTDEQRVALRINVRKQPSPVPAPESAPKIDIKSVANQTVEIMLHNGDVLKRARPPGVAGASVFSYVGATPPAEPGAWTFQGNTTKTTFTALFDGSSEAQTVWFTAFWFNPRGMSGPGTTPLSVNLPAAAPLPQTAQLKVAA